jgi:alkylated DNA repair dioxygenase AlkB
MYSPLSGAEAGLISSRLWSPHLRTPTYLFIPMVTILSPNSSDSFVSASSLNMTMTEENTDVEVGAPDTFDLGKRLLDQLNELKSVTGDITGHLLSTFQKTSLSTISTEDIKNCGKLNKKQLGTYLLTLLGSCHPLCHEANIDLVISPPIETAHNNLLSEMTQNMEGILHRFGESQDVRFKEIHHQITQLQSYTDSINAIRSHGNDCKPTEYVTSQHDSSSTHTQYTPDISIEELNILHPYNEHLADFITPELAGELHKIFNECDQFKENTETGHSVMTYGHPYHYVGSKNSTKGPVTDIKGPLLEVVKQLQEKFPGAQSSDLNSCLVNKYCGAEASLPNHADDEFCIDPTSSIFTVSIGSKATVRFTNQHNSSIEELVVEPNSVYVMSRASQQLWKHQICEGTLQESEVRYSLTFRHVSEKFLRSTIILGDSNTAKLNFGLGKGTFGHLIPGQRVKTIFIDDISPLLCCGYKNIFVHCGINSIKHYNVTNREKIEEHFGQLKTKIEQIMILCPNSNIFVSPVLPTKRDEWNARVIHFNKCLFAFEHSCGGKFSTLSFGMFPDPKTGLLRSELGSYWHPDDVLHLGSNGIRLLVGMVRERVLSNKVLSNKTYSAALVGHRTPALGTDHVAALLGPPGIAAS